MKHLLNLLLFILLTNIVSFSQNSEAPEKYILTPPASLKPRLNNPLVYGCRPGRDFLYRIPCQGKRPVTFTAKGLPPSLRLDKKTGIITGTSPAKGTYNVTLTAKNQKGRSVKSFKIISGDKIGLTPPMGWNHWYAYYDKPTDKLIRQVADVMLTTGLADAGYDYICIDDCWTNAHKNNKMNPQDTLRKGTRRDPQGNILPNAYFPDMKNMTDYLHTRGFKAGIYSSPAKVTCAGFEGSFGHEEQDAKQWATWGFDLIKYDRCTYPDDAPYGTLAEVKEPYVKIGDALKKINRDIYYSLCQYYGSEKDGDVWKWGSSIGGNSWRTGTDINAFLPDVFKVALRHAEFAQYQRPGEWNDPDFLMLGWIGDRKNNTTHPVKMHPNTQYAYVSLWSLMAAPLFFSSRIDKMDAFTLNLLTNPEIIAINQDPLGQCGKVIMQGNNQFLMVKDLYDGSKAVGFFNREKKPVTMTASWEQIGVTGKQKLRDAWRMKNLGTFKNEFTSDIPAEGCMVIILQNKSF